MVEVRERVWDRDLDRSWLEFLFLGWRVLRVFLIF